MDRILIIDAMNQIHRANIVFGEAKLKHCLMKAIPNCSCGEFWDFKTHSCPKDFITIFNFFRNLRPLVEDIEPDKIFFCLEGRPQFRYDLFPDYKANRIIKEASKKEAKIKLLKDANIIISLLKYLPMTICKADNFEADDVIGTLADNMMEEDITVISNDSDHIQLLQRGYKHITIYNPIKKIAMEAPNYLYVPWKCLAGDKSDNIPSLLKPKKALETVNNPVLFQRFMDDNENKARFNMNRALIEFRKVPEEEILFQEGNKDFNKLKEEFIKMEFASIINESSWEKYTKTFECIKF